VLRSLFVGIGVVFFGLFPAIGLRAQKTADTPSASAAPKLVIVTVERRVPRNTGENDYRKFLQDQRGQLLNLLFDRGTLQLNDGDMVALTTDGVEKSRVSQLVNTHGDVENVGRSLVQMLEIPGRTRDKIWLGTISKSLDRGALDDTIRLLVTCPLTNAPGLCSERTGYGRPAASRSFSRPLLTMPTAVRLTLEEIRRRQLPEPREVFWLWVQVGTRTNEINGLVEEIRRDFTGDTRRKVLEYWDSRMALLNVSYIPWASAPSATGNGGISAWSVASTSIRAHQLDTRALPILMTGRVGGLNIAVDSIRTVSERMILRSDALWETGSIRLQLDTANVQIGNLSPPVLVSASARARCRTDGSDYSDSTVQLNFDLIGNRRAAELDDTSMQTLWEFGKSCQAERALLSRLGASLFGGKVPSRKLLLMVSAFFAADSNGSGLPGTAWTSVRERAFAPQSASVGNVSMALFSVLVSLLIGSALVFIKAYFLDPSDYELYVGDEDDRSIDAQGRTLTIEKLASTNITPIPVNVRLLRGRARTASFAVNVVSTTLSHNVPMLGSDFGSLLLVHHTLEQTRLDNGRLSLSGLSKTEQKQGARIAEIHAVMNPAAIDFLSVRANVRYELSIKSRIEVTKTTLMTIPGVVRHTPLYFEFNTSGALRPVLQLHLNQTTRYRGISLRDIVESEGEALGLGAVQISRLPVAGHVSNPVNLKIYGVARLRVTGNNSDVPITCAIRFGSKLPGDEFIELNAHDQPEFHVPVLMSLKLPKDNAWRSAELLIELSGQWQDALVAEAPIEQLAKVSASAWFYRASNIYNVGLDIGTSATRMLIERQGDEARALVGLPGDLCHASAPAYLRTEQAYVEASVLGGELVSAILTDSDCQRLQSAGCLAQKIHDMTGKGLYMPSLKAWLLHDPNNQEAMKVQALFSEALQRTFSPAWAGVDSELVVCDFNEFSVDAQRDQWRKWSVRLPAGSCYVLVLTVPDSYSMTQRNRLVSLFGQWPGCLRAVTLREAEAAVLYFAAQRRQHAIGEYTLVVDVGAGTVDYAMVRTHRTKANEIGEIQVIATAVSFAAGDAANDALAVHLKSGEQDRRVIREKKEQVYSDIKSLVDYSAEKHEFMISPSYEQFMHNAIDVPLAQLKGRLAQSAGFSKAKTTAIILTGRGSLLAGMRSHLNRAVRTASLMGSAVDVQTTWDAQSLQNRVSFNLKQAVVEGAISLLSQYRVHFTSSSDFQRDHLLLIGLQHDADRLHAGVIIAPARTPCAVLEQGVAIDYRSFIEAKLIYSAVLPVSDGGSDPDVTWESIWRNSSNHRSDFVPSSAARSSWLVQNVSTLRWRDGTQLTISMHDDRISIEY